MKNFHTLIKHSYTDMKLLANNQFDAPFHVFTYFISLHISSITVLIIRRSNCINTSSGMISLWLLSVLVIPAYKSVTQTNHTRWCINTIRSPDDEHCEARNMQRDEINTWKSVSSWLLARICNEMHGEQNIKNDTKFICKSRSTENSSTAVHINCTS